MDLLSRIEDIEDRLNKTTKGNWMYDHDRGTGDFCIYVVGAIPDETDHIGFGDGVVGSSEWTWIEDYDGEFIANSKKDIKYLLSVIQKLYYKYPNIFIQEKLI